MSENSVEKVPHMSPGQKPKKFHLLSPETETDTKSSQTHLVCLLDKSLTLLIDHPTS